MISVETKYGVLYIENSPKQKIYNILDSDKNILFFGGSLFWVVKQIELIARSESLEDWLMNYDEVCWGSKKD